MSLDVEVGSPVTFDEDIYWNASTGQRQIGEVNLVSPFLGRGTTYDFAFPLEP